MFVPCNVYTARSTYDLGLEVIVTTSRSFSVKIKTETKQPVNNSTDKFALHFSAYIQHFHILSKKKPVSQNKE